jgi:phage terminase large subunit GpA-like protein
MIRQTGPLPDLRWFLAQARPRKIRSLRNFAEDEIVIPDGPFVGRRFRCARQPYTGLLFDELDTGRWSRCVATGPTQSGKTLSCFVIPILYHLFELNETVICGLPDMDMAGDKWRESLLPAIEQSRYRDLLPQHGGGSRGGKVESLQFRNGATLKFMSGGGGDKSRAGFTSRVVVITETDGMDEPGKTSRESDKITQLEARTRAYGSRKRVYMECTVSVEEGRTWREYQNSSKSRIVVPCPHCREWVTPEREHLVGWQGAETQAAAMSQACFGCPSCGEAWSADERTAANQAARLLHDGQTIDAGGNVAGPTPECDTLGFRWSGVNNLFLSPGELAADEWRASRSPDEENAEREMRQFVWCLPIQPLEWEQSGLEPSAILDRIVAPSRGIVPNTAKWLTAACDLGKYLVHWIVTAWSDNAVGHVVDYGRIEVASDDLGVEQGLMVALKQFRDQCELGWSVEGSGTTKLPDQVWIDSGYMTEVVYTFVRQQEGNRYRPAVGRGAAQQHRQWYNRPTQTGSLVKHIGEGFHINLLQAQRLFLVEIDADHWKTWVQARLSTPPGQEGAMTIFQAPPAEHLALSKHLTAERKVEEFIAGRGVVVRWERMRRQNHWLDALYNASCAASFCGMRLVAEPVRPPEPPPPAPHIVRRPDGRPWIDTESWSRNFRGRGWLGG